MNRHLLHSVIPACALLLIAGCTDDNYDLDSLDKTSAISINDLVVPINVDEISLNNIIDADNPDDNDASFVKMKDENGKEYYAFRRTGSFKSEEINIDAFDIKEPEDLDPTTSNAIKDDLPDPDVDVATSLKYNIDRMQKDFTYHITGVDSKVKVARQIETKNFYIKVILTVPSNMMIAGDKLTFKNLKIQFPKGLWMYENGNKGKIVSAKANIGTYNANTGLVTIPNYTTTKAETDLIIKANVIDLNPPYGLENVNNGFDFTSKIIFESGDVILTTSNVGRLPHTFTFSAKYELPSFEVDAFSGYIDYTIDGLNFDPINLEDMPEVLADPETRIKIANPQLYMSVENTCEPYDLGGELGLTLTAIREKGSIPYSLPEDIKVSANKVLNKFAISPAGATLKPISGYSAQDGAVLMAFPELSNVLYGNAQKGYGIPQSIEVEIPDPAVKGEAKRFPLGSSIKAVSGDYQFLAPIALDNGSIIVYNGKTDDWGLDDLEVRVLKVYTEATSDLPVDLTLKAWLIDKDGKHMGQCNTTTIPANAAGTPINIEITPREGEIMKDVDGIYYEATCVQDTEYPDANAVPAITPEMHLKLGKIKATLSGQYVTDFEDKDDHDN
ncbi:MAG: hypothetical protein K2M03_04690 [Muribaculaceae bacterium]|nr:hypothetical protein [Muribaculaceae bacterium]